jgi:hypothetical protein
MQLRPMPITVILVACELGACGLTNPNIKEIWDSDYPGNPQTGAQPISATMLIEFEIKKKIYCELKDAVMAANGIPTTTSATMSGAQQTLKYPGLFPPGWIAQVVISLQVDESSALNPGVTLNDTLANAVKTFGVGNSVTVGQSFNLGLGGTLSSTATRIDKFNPQYSIDFLSTPNSSQSVCIPGNDPFEALAPRSSPFLIESHLGIKEWLVDAMLVNDYLPSDLTHTETKTAAPERPLRSTRATASAPPGGGGATKADTVSYEIKFVIVSSGNITPTWKLLRASANTGSLPFFALGRTRTHDLIITIGPDNTTTSNSNLASQISSGVGSANRALLIGN